MGWLGSSTGLDQLPHISGCCSERLVHVVYVVVERAKPSVQTLLSLCLCIFAKCLIGQSKLVCQAQIQWIEEIDSIS